MVDGDLIKTPQDLGHYIRLGCRDFRSFGRVNTTQWEGLLLFNYRNECQYDGNWNAFELMSRGLIMDATTGAIVARPFDKFFNWMQDGRHSTAKVRSITEKLDGSLGIIYWHPYLHRIMVATRGSFTSEQAVWATEWINTHWGADTDEHMVIEGLLAEGHTLLVEIIYPENRIVLDYQGQAKLVLLAIRGNKEGDYANYDSLQMFAKEFRLDLALPMFFGTGSTDIESILRWAKDRRENEEGVVVEFTDGQRFKFKTEWYVHLHKLLSGLNKRRIYEACASGTFDTLVELIPDEFMPQVRVWQEEAENAFQGLYDLLPDLFSVAPKEDRKTFALWVKQHYPDLARYLFAMLDGKDIAPIIWKSVVDQASNSLPLIFEQGE